MLKYIDVSGKTEDEAIAKALEQLSLDRDDVSVEILERAKSGFFGIGGTPATVRVSYDDGEPEPKPEQKPTGSTQELSPLTTPERRAGPKKPESGSEPKKPEPKPEPPKGDRPQTYQPEVLQKDKRAKDRPEREQGRPARTQDKPEREPKKPRPARESAPLGEECTDEKATQIRTFLTGLLTHMDSAAEARVYEVEKGRYKVILDGDKLGALIGRRGETLDAIQQLTSYAVNRGSEKGRVRVQVDAENYREKREQSLERLAEKVAAKVTKYRRNVTLEPMNAYERHVIHTALQDVPNVTTFSIGTEPNRRVVVSYDRTK